ncbi:MAG: hypothetical protein DHS80DRAFT_25909 [Piptocephalis tieghemiana]|nr:MAG: hypothetical protein DHS80DRAFT_25909 [Piptocephalis tieghemiana]
MHLTATFAAIALIAGTASASVAGRNYQCWTPGYQGTMFAKDPTECPSRNPPLATGNGGIKCNDGKGKLVAQVMDGYSCPLIGDVACWTPGSEGTLRAVYPEHECPASRPPAYSGKAKDAVSCTFKGENFKTYSGYSCPKA